MRETPVYPVLALVSEEIYYCVPDTVPVTIERDTGSLKQRFEMLHHRAIVRRVISRNGTDLGERK